MILNISRNTFAFENLSNAMNTLPRKYLHIHIQSIVHFRDSLKLKLKVKEPLFGVEIITPLKASNMLPLLNFKWNLSLVFRMVKIIVYSILYVREEKNHEDSWMFENRKHLGGLFILEERKLEKHPLFLKWTNDYFVVTLLPM